MIIDQRNPRDQREIICYIPSVQISVPFLCTSAGDIVDKSFPADSANDADLKIVLLIIDQHNPRDQREIICYIPSVHISVPFLCTSVEDIVNKSFSADSANGADLKSVLLIIDQRNPRDQREITGNKPSVQISVPFLCTSV